MLDPLRPIFTDRVGDSEQRSPIESELAALLGDHTVESKLDREFAIELAELETALIRDRVNRDSIDAMIDYRRSQFVAWRREHLAELRDWLAECNRKLH
jgi:hypothetical protein